MVLVNSSNYGNSFVKDAVSYCAGTKFIGSINYYVPENSPVRIAVGTPSCILSSKTFT